MFVFVFVIYNNNDEQKEGQPERFLYNIYTHIILSLNKMNINYMYTINSHRI